MRALVAYVPVLHEGYRKFFEQYKDEKLFLLGKEVTENYRPLVKDIRALDPALTKRAVESLAIFSSVEVAGKEALKGLALTDIELVMPKEDVSEAAAKEYFSNKKVIFEPVFLRWDRKKTLEKNKPFPDQAITKDEFAREMMQNLAGEAQRSSDFWRQVGAAVIHGGKIISTAHNHHVPSEHTPYQDGDPRGNFGQGEYLELSTAIHAEAALVANAAKQGISLQGADMYVTTFPCPPCAKLIAYAGIKTLYYSSGYAVLDGENILKSQGVKLIFVE